MSLPQNSSARQAVAQLVAELGRAKRALAAGAVEDARDALARARALDPGNLQAAALEEQLQGGTRRPAARPPSMPATVMEQPAWLSFERKVRERRAARCVERADAALAVGAAADAAAAIDELEQLVPVHPRLAELRARAEALAMSPSFESVSIPEPPAAELDRQDDESLGEVPIVTALPAIDRPAPAPIPRPAPAARSASARHGVAMLVAMLLLIGGGFALGSWWWLRNTEPLATSGLSTRHAQGNGADPVAADANIPQAAPTLTSPPTASQESETSAPPPGATDMPPSGLDEAAQTLAAQVPDAGNATTGDETPPITSSQPSSSPPPDQAAVQETSQSASNAVTTDAQGGGPSSPGASAPPSAPLGEVARPVGTVGTGVRPAPSTSISPSEAIAPLGNGLPAPAPEEAPVREPEAPAAAAAGTGTRPAARTVTEVKQVLDQYALGYSSRQAAVVRKIWPSVDARALERAFGQLQSQQVSFDTCTIDAAEVTATATCSGRARWVPAVGDRSPREQSRTWRFVLGRGTQGWIITEARVGSQ